MGKKVLIIGATGSVGRVVRPYLLENTDDYLTLFARRTGSLRDIDDARERVFEGDVYDPKSLDEAMHGQDAVFAALSGDLRRMAEDITQSMERCGVSRLIFITSMGIYNEIPAWGAGGNLRDNAVLQPYRDAADVIERTNLDYTIIRPGWYTGGPVNYEVTQKGEPFGGHDISRESIADLVMKLINDNDLYRQGSVGINTPGS